MMNYLERAHSIRYILISYDMELVSLGCLYNREDANATAQR